MPQIPKSRDVVGPDIKGCVALHKTEIVHTEPSSGLGYFCNYFVSIAITEVADDDRLVAHPFLDQQ